VVTVAPISVPRGNPHDNERNKTDIINEPRHAVWFQWPEKILATHLFGGKMNEGAGNTMR